MGPARHVAILVHSQVQMPKKSIKWSIIANGNRMIDHQVSNLCSASDSHSSTWPPTSSLSIPQTDEATARMLWEAKADCLSFHASLLGSYTREESQWVSTIPAH